MLFVAVAVPKRKAAPSRSDSRGLTNRPIPKRSNAINFADATASGIALSSSRMGPATAAASMPSAPAPRPIWFSRERRPRLRAIRVRLSAHPTASLPTPEPVIPRLHDRHRPQQVTRRQRPPSPPRSPKWTRLVVVLQEALVKRPEVTAARMPGVERPFHGERDANRTTQLASSISDTALEPAIA